MANDNQYLPFEIDGIHYAVPLSDVAYVISSADQYPCCAPPKCNSCVKYMMRVDQNLMAVVELTALGKSSAASASPPQRPFILALHYRSGLTGLLVDHISPLLEITNPKFEKDPLNQRTFLISSGKNMVLFDVLKLHGAMETM